MVTSSPGGIHLKGRSTQNVERQQAVECARLAAAASKGVDPIGAAGHKIGTGRPEGCGGVKPVRIAAIAGSFFEMIGRLISKAQPPGGQSRRPVGIGDQMA